MDLDFRRSIISNGIYFTEIRNRKFKNNRISVTLAAPLCEETASSYAVLPFILRKGFRSCPDAAQFNRLLTSLYGANCDFDVRKAGDTQLLSLSISAIDDRFTLNGETITAEISKILCSLLLDPVIENGAFQEKTFETEKQALIDSIKAELNDKVALAKARCQQLMCQGHPSAISRYGTLECAQALTCREVFDAYNTLLKKARIEIIFTGSGDADAAREIFTSSFHSCAEREEPFDISSCIKAPGKEIKQHTEAYNITQSKLSMGFTCSTAIGDSDEAAMNVMTVILGGAPFSKLFLNVREKLSLCYYCSASYDHFKGTIFINSGIEAENREKAQTEILAQLEALQNGELSEEEIANARKLFTNVYTGIADSISRSEGFFLNRLISGTEITPDEELEQLLSVTADDIINAARKVSLDTVYFMAPKEEK